MAGSALCLRLFSVFVAPTFRRAAPANALDPAAGDSPLLSSRASSADQRLTTGWWRCLQLMVLFLDISLGRLQLGQIQ